MLNYNDRDKNVQNFQSFYTSTPAQKHKDLRQKLSSASTSTSSISSDAGFYSSSKNVSRLSTSVFYNDCEQDLRKKLSRPGTSSTDESYNGFEQHVPELDLRQKISLSLSESKSTNTLGHNPEKNSLGNICIKVQRQENFDSRKIFYKDKNDSNESHKSINDVPILIPRSPRKSIKFFSPDEAENADNNDPEWEKVKKLTTEDQFRQYAHYAFGCQSINPNKCQSYHGFRSKQLRVLSTGKCFRPTSKSHTPLNEYKNMSHKNRSLVGNKRKALDDLTNEMPLRKRLKMMPFDTYAEEICKAMGTHKLSCANYYGDYRRSRSGLTNQDELLKRNWSYRLRHFKKSMEDMKSCITSISCDNHHIVNEDSGLYLSYEELKKTTDLEMIFGQFIKFYGPNEEVKCKDCTAMDGFPVWHQY